MAANTVTIAAHAKANLFLRVLARETSAYHTIETLFTLLELHDELMVERTDDAITLAVEGAETGPVEENLAYRAAQMVLDATGRRFGVAMRLIKHIPVRSGLGGGSSDGAAALHAVNALAERAIPNHEILQFAAKLGSDVPFFASGAALALGWGRGERLMRLPAPASVPVLIAVPSFGISTAAAYQALDRARSEEHGRGSVVLDADAFETWGNIGRLGGNDFESVVFAQEGALRELYERLAETRPLLVRLAGSGSAIIALYKNEGELDAAALEVGERDWTLIRTATRHSGAPAVDRG